MQRLQSYCQGHLRRYIRRIQARLRILKCDDVINIECAFAVVSIKGDGGRVAGYCREENGHVQEDITATLYMYKGCDRNALKAKQRSGDHGIGSRWRKDCRHCVWTC